MLQMSLRAFCHPDLIKSMIFYYLTSFILKEHKSMSKTFHTYYVKYW